MMLLPSHTRRWQRLEVDLSVTVGRLDGISNPTVRGRATELSEGGMALYAGLNLQPQDLIEVEFQAPSQASVTGLIRNRVGFCFGLEFLTPLPIDVEGDRNPQLPYSQVAPFTEPGPLAPAAAEIFDQLKREQGDAAAYTLLAQVLEIADRPDEAEKALERALASFIQARDSIGQQNSFALTSLRQKLEALRVTNRLLTRAEKQKQIDPRLPDLICQLPELLD